MTVVTIILLVIILKILKKNAADKKRLKLQRLVAQEEIFEKNCILFSLSTREMEVVPLILAGHTYRSAAETLHISEKTIDSHMRSVYAKVGVRNIISLYKRLYDHS
ncbi:response regulator transcription factor [Mucilaginibacter sp. UYCu711]|uniref:response regulator transcription factor n=1 Tax=Mucilaginibacter sp. UYCu711 TaxID=3156339 RepID=UPI003D22E8DB